MNNLTTGSILLLAASAFGPSPAAAQTDPPAPEARVSAWEGSLELSLGQRIGRERPFDSTEDVVDEGENELAFTLQRSNTIGSLPVAVTGGLTYSPYLFDDDEEPESAQYGEITLGDAFIPLHRLRPFKAGQATNKVQDAPRPYARYRYTRAFRGLLEDFQRNEHQITIGFRFRDIRTIMCDQVLRPASEVGACTNVPGWSWEVRGEANRIWSSDPDEERLVPSVRAEV